MKNFLSLSFEEKHKMGELGRKKVEAEFDDKLIAQEIVDTIEEIL